MKESSTIPHAIDGCVEMVVDLALGAEQVKQLYRGAARNVVVRARDGRWVQFPARLLRAHVDALGVYGTFVLHVHGGRLTTIARLPS